MIFPYQLIDLTHTLNPQIPTWGGGCGFHHDIQLDYNDCESDDKFRVMKIKMHAGIGTHMDAPSHCVPDGQSVHDFDLNDCCMPCIMIDISIHAHEHYSLTIEDLQHFEQHYGIIPANSCVLIRTGWSDFWDDPEKYRNHHVFPSISAKAAAFLLNRGVNALGIDTLSPDRPQDGFKVHQLFLGAGKILIENVTSLEKLPPIGSFVMIVPMKIKDATEAPVRLIGLLKSEAAH